MVAVFRTDLQQYVALPFRLSTFSIDMLYICIFKAIDPDEF